MSGCLACFVVVLYWRGLFLNRLSKSKKAEADLKEANDIALRNELTPDHDLRNNSKADRQTDKQTDRLVYYIYLE